MLIDTVFCRDHFTVAEEEKTGQQKLIKLNKLVFNFNTKENVMY